MRTRVAACIDNGADHHYRQGGLHRESFEADLLVGEQVDGLAEQGRGFTEAEVAGLGVAPLGEPPRAAPHIVTTSTQGS